MRDSQNKSIGTWWVFYEKSLIYKWHLVNLKKQLPWELREGEGVLDGQREKGRGRKIKLLQAKFQACHQTST